MADFGAPVAEGINGPAQNLPMLNNIMNLRLQQQQLQSGALGIAGQQAQLPAIQAEAQVKQQKAQQTQAFSQFVQKGVDENGNSIRTPDGEVDPTKLVGLASRVAPLSPEIAQNIVSTMDTRLKLADSNRQLGQSYKDDIAGIIRSSMGDSNSPPEDPATISSKIDAYVKQQGQDAPQALDQSATYMKSLIGKLNGAPPDSSKLALLHLAQQYEPTANVAAQQQPNMAAITTPGGKFQPVQTNALSPIPMGATGPATEQGLAPQIYTDAAGQPHYIGGGPSPVGQSGPASQFPSTPDVQAQQEAVKNMSTHFNGLNAAAASYPLVHDLSKTIQGLAPGAFTGGGTQTKQAIVSGLNGILSPIGIQLTGNEQTDTNLINKAMAQLNINTPAGTDAMRTLVEASQPHAAMNQAAIKEAAGTVDAQMKMNAVERDWLNNARFASGGSGNLQQYQQGRQIFENNADPRIWQYEDMVKTDPTAAKSFIARQPDKKELIQKTEALTKMGFFK